MSQQVNIALNFSANTQQAKTALQDLQTNLTKIAFGTDVKVNPGQIQQASSAAKELAFHLNEAYNANTGNIDLTRLNTSLKSAGMNVSTLSSQLLSAGTTGQQAFVQLARTISMAEAPVLRVSSAISRMAITLANTFRYQVASYAISGAVQALSGAIDYAQELNKSLNNIRIVTGYSADEMSKFAVEANKAAKALSTTTTAYTDASLIFYQQGLTGDAVKERADVVVKLANVTSQAAETVSDQMTAIWNNFADGSQSMEYYADVITKLGAATASSTDEISDGLEKFAAVSETVGLSYEMATAALATVTAETRQSADVVGTAFKTIFSRMEGLKLGETLEDGTTLNKYSQALATAGVNIKDQNGQLKNMDDILSELGSKWDNMNKDTQIALAQSVAGVRQYNQFLALMGNWDKVQENLEVAINSTGELNAQADIYEQSWEAASNRVKASLEAVYSDVFKDDFFIEMTDGLANIVDGIHGFLDSVGGIGPVLIGISGIFMTMFANKMPSALLSLKNNFLIAFGQGSKVIEQMNLDTQRMIDSELKRSASGLQYNEVQKQQLQNAGQLSNIKTQLASKESQLSDIEKRRYDFEIQGIQLQQEELVTLQEKARKLRENLKTLTNTVTMQEKMVSLTKSQEKAELAARKQKSSTEQEYLEARENIGGKTGVSAKKGWITREKKANKIDKTAITNKEKQLNDSSIGETEKIRIQEEIAELEKAVQTRQKHIDSLNREIQTYNSKKEAYQSAIATQNQEFANSEQQSMVISSITERINLLSSEYIQLGGDMTKAGAEAKKALNPFTEQINQIDALLADGIPEEQFLQDASKMGQMLNQIFGDGIAQAFGFEEALQKLDLSDPEKARAGFEQLRKSLNGAEIDANNFIDIIQKLDLGSDDIQDFEKLKQIMEEITTKANNLDAAIDNLNFSHAIKGSEAFTSALGGISSLAFGLQSLTQVWKTIEDPDMSGWDKFLSITMGISMGIPMLTSGIKGLGGAYQWLNRHLVVSEALHKTLIGLKDKQISDEVKLQALQKMGLTYDQAENALTAINNALSSEENQELLKKNKATEEGIILDTLEQGGYLKEAGLKSTAIALTKKETAEINKKTIADAAETKGIWAKFAALVSTNWILLIIVAAIAALVAIIYACIAAQKQAEANSPEGRLKAASERVKKLNEELEKTKNHIDQIRDATEKWQNSFDKIKGLTKGTQEWNIALRESNLALLELLQLYPQLRTMQIGGQSAVYTDINGIMTIRPEALDQLNSNLLQQENANLMTQIYSQFSLKDYQAAVDKEDLQSENVALYDTISGENSSSSYTNVLDFINKSIRENPTQGLSKEDISKLIKTEITNDDETINYERMNELIPYTIRDTYEYDAYENIYYGDTQDIAKQNKQFFNDNSEDYMEKVIDPLLDDMDHWFANPEIINMEDYVSSIAENEKAIQENSQALYENSKILASSILGQNEEYNKMDSMEQQIAQNLMAGQIAEGIKQTQSTISNRSKETETLEGITLDQLQKDFGEDYVKQNGDNLKPGDDKVFDNGAVTAGLFGWGSVKANNGLGEFVVNAWAEMKKEQGVYTDVSAQDYDEKMVRGEEVDLRVTTAEGQEVLENQNLVTMYEEVAAWHQNKMAEESTTDILNKVNALEEGTKLLLTGNLEAATEEEYNAVKEEASKINSKSLTTLNEEEANSLYLQAQMAGFKSDLADVEEAKADMIEQFVNFRSEAIKSYNAAEAGAKRFALATQEANASLESTAEQTGFSEKALKSYAKQIAKNTEGYNENSKEGAKIYKTAVKQAEAYARAAAGVDELSDSLEDNLGYLQDWKKDSGDMEDIPLEVSDAAFQVAEALEGVFGIETDHIFVLDNLDLFDDLIEGAEGAGQKMRQALEDNYLEMLENGGETSQEIGEMLSDFKVNLNSEDFIEKANQMILDGKTTSDEINKSLNAIGYEGEVEEVDMTSTTTQYYPNYEVVSENGVAKILPTGETTKVEIPTTGKVKLLKPKDGGEIGSTDSSTTATLSGGGSGLISTESSSINYDGIFKQSSNKEKSSGSSSKKENKEKKKRSDEIERYHEIDKRIAASSNKLDNLNSEMEKAFDKDRVGLMRQEVDLLNNSLDLENQKLKEVKSNLDKDRVALQAYGAEFDNDGNLINYDEIMNQQLDILDQAYDRYNKSSKEEADEEALEKAEEAYEEFKEILEQYEETNELHWEQLQTINDKELEIWQKYNDIIIEEMEQRVEAFEEAADALGRQIDYLDKKLEKLEDEEYSQAKAASLLGNEMGAALEQAQSAQEEYNSALKKYNNLLADSEASEDTIKQAWEDVMNAADAVDETTTTIEDIQDRVDELLLSHLEDQAEDFANISDELEHYNGVLSNYQNILELLGRTYQNDVLMKKLSQSQVDNAKASIANARAQYELLTSQLEAAKESGASEETIEELTNQQREAQNALMDSLSAGLEAVAAKYESDMLIAIKNTEQSLTNGKFYSLEEAQEYYDQQKSIKELYVEEYDKLYQLNKLSRDINKSMSNADSLLANQKLSDLLDEINEKRESGVEMSQYELDTLQKKYDLRLAEIALEEAQNAKNSMRLMRDSQGNWGYVYTADQSKIDEAQQKYEDALYNLEKSSREYLDQMQEAILSNEKEMLSRIQELRVSDYANYDDYLAAIDEIRQQHQAKNDYYYNQMGIAIDDINAAYGTQVLVFDNLAIAEVKDIKTIEEGISGFNTSVDKLLTEAGTSFSTYLGNQQEVTEEAGLDLDQLTDTMSTDIDTISDKTKTLKEDIDDVKNKAEIAFGGVLSAIQALNIQYSSEAQKIIDENNKIVESFLGIYAHKAQVGNYLKGYDENLDYSAAMTDYIKKGGQASDAAFIDLIIGRNNKTSDPSYAQWKDNFGGLTQAEAMAVFAIADQNSDAMAWVKAFNTGTQTDAQIAAARKALLKNTTAYDYTEMMQAYLLGGGKASDSLFQTIWKNFVDKLDEKDTDGQTFKDKYYKNKTLEEIWTQFAIMGAGDSYTAKMPSFATGGYTGEWGPEGKLAMLHEKELILNKSQTEDFLNSLEVMSHIVDTIDRNSKLAAAGLAIDKASTPAITEKVVQQTVAIEASFPGVQTAIEIEEAFNNIINDAVQYASIYKN